MVSTGITSISGTQLEQVEQLTEFGRRRVFKTCHL